MMTKYVISPDLVQPGLTERTKTLVVAGVAADAMSYVFAPILRGVSLIPATAVYLAEGFVGIVDKLPEPLQDWLSDFGHRVYGNGNLHLGTVTERLVEDAAKFSWAPFTTGLLRLGKRWDEASAKNLLTIPKDGFCTVIDTRKDRVDGLYGTSKERIHATTIYDRGRQAFVHTASRDHEGDTTSEVTFYPERSLFAESPTTIKEVRSAGSYDDTVTVRWTPSSTGRIEFGRQESAERSRSTGIIGWRGHRADEAARRFSSVSGSFSTATELAKRGVIITLSDGPNGSITVSRQEVGKPTVNQALIARR